jgi:VRR-NUC domain
VHAAVLESDLQKEIMLAAPSVDCRLLRNNVGAFQDKTGRWVRFGLGGGGGSDLIGWTIWRGMPVFTAVEVKRKPKKPTPEQAAFLNAVRESGGIAVVAYSVDDFLDAVHGYRSKP